MFVHLELKFIKLTGYITKQTKCSKEAVMRQENTVQLKLNEISLQKEEKLNRAI